LRTVGEDYLENLEQVRSHADEIRREVRSYLPKQVQRVVLVGSGANYSQMFPVQRLMVGLDAPVDCYVFSGGELERQMPPKIGSGSVVIGMSHSGNTTEIQLALEAARSRGATVFGVSKSMQSGLAQTAHYHYAYPNGSNMSEMKLLVLSWMMVAIADHAGSTESGTVHSQLGHLPAYLRDSHESYAAGAKQFADDHAGAPMIYSLACGGSYGAAYAFTLSKLMEMQWKDAASVDAGEFFHGPLEVADGDRVFLLWAAGDAASRQTYRVRDYLHQKGCAVHLVGTDKSYPVESDAAQRLLSPFMLWPALNMYAWALEEATGHDLDKRRNMGQSGTEYPWAAK
jgi:fructoselysine-6-P-deglycase FrlB-like protein